MSASRTVAMQRGAALWLLLAASQTASAVGGVAVLASLPPFPAHIASEQDCQALADASTTFRAQSQAVRSQLDTEAEAAQKTFEQQMAQGKAQMDVTQAMQFALYMQESKNLDPDSHYCRSQYFPVDTGALGAGQKMLQGLRAAGQSGQARVEACARDEFTAHAQRCTQPIVDGFDGEKQKLIAPYIGALTSAYGIAQGKAKQCVAMGAGLDAKYAAKAKGIFRYHFDARLADATAAGMAGQLADEAHGRCMDIVRIVDASLATLLDQPAPPPTFDFFHPEY